MEDSKITSSTDYEGLKTLQALREKQLMQRRLQTKIGGVISLKSLWSAICPEKLNKIKGHIAVVKAKESENGSTYLYIEIPFIDGENEELRIGMSDLDEGDEVDIISIIAMFIDKGNGETIIRYFARYIEKKDSFNLGDVKTDIIDRCTGLMMDSDHIEMSIRITYEGGECPSANYGIIKGDNVVTLCLWYDESSSWQTIQISGYQNAKPLTRGLILAEDERKVHYILTSNGAVMYKNFDSLDFGPDYLICKNRLWWYSNKTNLWGEMAIPHYQCNALQERVKLDSLSLTRIHINDNNYVYVYDCSMIVERFEFDAGGGNGDWWPQDAVHVKGLLDKNGIWRIEPKEDIKTVKLCHSLIIVQKDNNVSIFDSNKTSRGLFKELLSVDKCDIKCGKYLLLTKDSLQGIYDAESMSLIIPCCIDKKFTLMPKTIGYNMVGVYETIDKKKGKCTIKKEKYFYLDYQGTVRLEIEDGWIIVGGFHGGKARIRRELSNEIILRTIDTTGSVLEEDYINIPSESYEDNKDEDNWYAMTDGMYGDYPEEGFDGDYEFMGL